MVLILFSLLHASSFLLSDVAGIVAGVLGEGSTDGSPAAVQAKIEEDMQFIGTGPLGLPMKLTKTINGTGCDYIPMPTSSPTSECDAGTERLEVTLVTDNYASDTSWELVNTGTNQMPLWVWCWKLYREVGWGNSWIRRSF